MSQGRLQGKRILITAAAQGIGRASAEVSLYLSGTVAIPGQLLGSAIVGMDNIWVITPTSPQIGRAHV